MSDAYSSGCAGGAIRFESGHATALRAADWLSLAAAPTFAIMALLTGVLGGGQPDILCSAAEHMSPLNGMIPMYLLMSAFHSPPWLKLMTATNLAASRRVERTCCGHREIDAYDKTRSGRDEMHYTAYDRR